VPQIGIMQQFTETTQMPVITYGLVIWCIAFDQVFRH
jgi:hypothetical protein